MLTTSRQAMKNMAAAMGQMRCIRKKIFRQDDEKRSLKDTIAAFRTDGNAILIGTYSLWEGVDLQGELWWLLINCRSPYRMSRFSAPAVRPMKMPGARSGTGASMVYSSLVLMVSVFRRPLLNCARALDA